MEEEKKYTGSGLAVVRERTVIGVLDRYDGNPNKVGEDFVYWHKRLEQENPLALQYIKRVADGCTGTEFELLRFYFLLDGEGLNLQLEESLNEPFEPKK